VETERVFMPEGHDVEHDTAEISSEYECLQCGKIVRAETHPGECPECGGDFQNRAKSLE
jgi:rubrerythrin